MKLRIISGGLKGRYVVVDPGPAPGGVRFRPTQERVRESVAEIVKKRIRGCVAADICAGSGAFGFELLSRGAARVDFVEADKAAAAAISGNAYRLGVAGRARVVRGDARTFADRPLGEGRGYDIVFYDPPYGDAELGGLVPKLLPLVNAGGLLIYERRRRPKEKKAAGTEGKADIIEARVYSDTVIELYGKERDADSYLPRDV
ncbi:MAG: RsmD family RNA methyltransferase [Chitinispirillales bacterium]|jgi:16S rRNA (guanine966-N2)-methyltransferase|nr:RsmD family RNA methyltransferase [Chitinispirillales bacterium]